MKTTRRLFALVMVVCLLAGYVVLPASAESSDTPAATLSFADTTARFAFSTEEQVWKANGITFTNSKSDSTNDVADYSNPVRLYKSSSVKVEYPGMTKVVFTCAGADKNVFTEAELSGLGTVTISGKVVTLTLGAPADSISFVVSAQRRVAELAVYTGSTGSTDPSSPTDPSEPVSSDPVADSELTVAEAIALGTSKEHNTYTEGKYYVTGKITEVYNTQYGNMRIADADGNILTIYGTYNADGTVRYDALETKPVAGDTVKVYGIIGQFNGTAQMKNGWIVEHTPDESQGNEPTNPDPEADSELTIAAAIALGASKEHNTYTEGKYYVTGEITEVYNTKYGNMRIADADGNVLTIYGTYSVDGSTRYDSMDVKPVAGDTVKVYGIIGQFNGTAQMKNGWIVEHTPAAPIPGESAENPIELSSAMFEMLDDGVSAAYTVTVPVGTTYFALYNAGGRELSINGQEPVLVTTGRGVPYAFSITNEGTEAAEYVLTLVPPVGSWENPLNIGMLNMAIDVPANSADGYYVTYSSRTPGTLVLEPSCDNENIRFNVTLTNMTTNDMASLKDGVVSMEMKANDTVLIWIEITADEDGTYPAASVALNGKVESPVGSWENPEVIKDGTVTAKIEAGSNGYYYTYTASEAGAVKVSVESETGWQFSVNNLTQWKYGDIHYSNADPLVSSEMVAVKAGDELEIIVNTFDPNSWDIPAGEVTVTFEFIGTVKPTEGETVSLEWKWDDNYTVGTATVTVPAGKINTYESFGIGGMQLVINGGEPELLPAGSPKMPVTFTIANDMPFEQTYDLVVSYPKGHMANPELLDEYSLGTLMVKMPDNCENGYFYKFTSDTDMELEVFIAYLEEGMAGDISVTDQNSIQKMLSTDGVDGVLKLSVKAGDELTICVMTFEEDDMWSCPATTAFWSINYPAGSEMNPLRPQYDWNEDGSVGEYTITVGAGETFYLELVHDGAELTVNGGEPIPITGNPYIAQPYTITNEGTEPAEYKLVVSYPIGTYQNPEDIEKGETKATFEEGTAGVYYDFVAPATGKVTLKVSGETWQYQVTNKTQSTSTDVHRHDDTNVVDTDTIEVKKGDVIVIFVSTYDPENMWYSPAGEIAMNLSMDVLGDLDGDGTMGIVDLMMLANSFAGKDVDIHTENADIDGNGKVNVSDLMKLANVLAGKDTLD